MLILTAAAVVVVVVVALATVSVVGRADRVMVEQTLQLSERHVSHAEEQGWAQRER